MADTGRLWLADLDRVSYHESVLIPLLLAVASLERGITCEMRAARLPVVFKKLSAQSHTELTCAPTMSDTILLISVHDMPREKLMERIADATCGKWATAGQGFTLLFDTKRAEAQEKAALERLAGQISRAQEKFAASIKLEPFTPVRAQLLLDGLGQYDELALANNYDGQRAYRLMDSLKRDMPAQRALNKIASMLDPKLLASLPRGRSALSDRPTRMEYRLPDSIRSVLDDFVKETRVWLSVFKGDPAYDSRPSHAGGDPRSIKAVPEASKLKIFINVTKYNRWDTPNLNVEFADENNSVVASGGIGLPGVAVSPPEILKPQLNLTPLTLSAEAQRYHDALMAEPKVGRPGVEGELKKQLLDPVSFEPLSYVPSELILQAARAENLDVVASLPDISQGFNYVFTKLTPPEKRTIGNVWRILYGQYITKTENGCLTVSPKERVKPINRQSLAILLRSIDAEGILRLDPAADFMAGEEFDNLPLLVFGAMDAIVPGSFAASTWTWGERLKFYGLLTAEQRKRLKEGSTVTIRELSAAARSQLRSLVYNNIEGLNLYLHPNTPFKGPSRSLYLEAPEAMPDGLDSSGQFGMTIQTLKAVMATADGAIGQSPSMIVTLRSLAAHQLAPTFPQIRSSDPFRDQMVTTITPGTQLRLDVEFTFTSEVQAHMTLFDAEFNLRSTPTSLDALPEAYKKDLEIQVGELKKQYGGG